MLHDLEVQEILEIAPKALTVVLKPGEFLFRESEEAKSLYIVCKGSVRVMSGSTVYETVPVGGIVGEMGIIEENGSRSASVIAVTHAELIEIDVERFTKLVAARPDFAITIMRSIARRLRVMNQRYRHHAAK